MTDADFAYDIARDAAGLPASIAVFADRAAMRGQIVEDLSGAGFRAIDGGEVATLLEGQIKVLGDVVLIDCPVVDAETIAALSRLDMRVARSGSQLIVSTSLDALDDVFAALDQSNPQILVNPSRAERVVAVGRILPGIGDPRLREMPNEDRLMLVQLAQQVETIARKLDGLSSVGNVEKADEAKLNDFKSEFRGLDTGGVSKIGAKSAHPPLPDPRLVRRIIANRQARARFFEEALFSDPAWDMLLDLTAAHCEQRRVSVTSLCIAAGVPATTALRWVRQMVESGVFERVADASDKRRAFITLSDTSVDAMARYFASIDTPLAVAA